MSFRLRVLTFLIAGVAAGAENPPAASTPDPAFSKVPFDQWLTEGGAARFQWTARVTGGDLDRFQRLRARVEIQVDGRELAKRKGRGGLVFFVQFSDSDHRRYQTHAVIPLQDVAEAASKSNFVYAQDALVVPGDYRVDVAVLDTGNGEHAALQQTLHVAPLRNDPLPDSWNGLPPVEFIAAADPPDAWFQPQLEGRLHLPLETRRPVRVEVLLNASPSAGGPRFHSSRVTSQGLRDLLPAVKAISQMDLSQGTLNVSVVDLTHQQVLLAQNRVGPRAQPLDWPRLRTALGQADPNKVDVRDLANRQQNPQFFVDEVRRRVTAEADPGGIALVVLSGPMEFNSGEDLRRIELEEKPRGKVFYIRYHPFLPQPVIAGPQYPNRPNRRFGYPQGPVALAAMEPADGLAPLLKPLQPRVFDVYKPEQFRRALADVMREIARM